MEIKNLKGESEEIIYLKNKGGFTPHAVLITIRLLLRSSDVFFQIRRIRRRTPPKNSNKSKNAKSGAVSTKGEIRRRIRQERLPEL